MTNFAMTSDTKGFAAALKIAARAAYRNAPHSVFACVRIESNGDGAVSITCTDLEKRATVTAPGSCVGAACVDVKSLAGALRGESGPVTVAIDDGGSSVSVSLPSGACVSLKTESLDDFPADIDVGDPTFALSAPRAALLDALAAALPAAATDRMRFALNGVLLRSHGGRVQLVATDGRRLHIVDACADVTAGEIPSRGVIIPRDSAKPILTSLKVGRRDPSDARIIVECGRFHVRIVDDLTGVEFVTRELEGTFPDADSVVPKRDSAPMTFVTAVLVGALEPMVRALKKSAFPMVRWTDEGSDMVLTAKDADSGYAAEMRVPILGTGRGGYHVPTGFNPGFVLDALRAHGTDVVALSFSQNLEREPDPEEYGADDRGRWSHGPLRIDGAEDRVAIVMPVSLD